jgi:hypothetical protein
MIAGARDAAAQLSPSLTPFRGRVFLLQAAGENGVVFITSNAVLVADPLELSVGQWLRGELTARFPGRPITTIVYTSDRPERTAGAAAFADATVIAHREFNTRRLSSAPQTRGVLPERAFQDGIEVSVGGIEVTIVNPGASFATPALFFRDERVLYVAGHPAFSSEGFGFGSARGSEMLEWFREVSTLPFDAVIAANGQPMSREAFDIAHRYAEDLARVATDGYLRGWSAERTASAAPMQPYSGTRLDARRRTSIDSFFRSAGVTRVELQVAGITRLIRPSSRYCEGYDPCAVTERIVGGSGALRLTRSRLGVLLEASSGQQFVSQRGSRLEDEIFAQRSSRGSLLFRVGKIRPSSWSIDLLAGPSIVVNDTSGTTRVKEAIAPRGGVHPFSEREVKVTTTGGVNLVAPLSRALSVYVPLRVTWLPASASATDRRPDRLDLQAGVGFSFRLQQSVR